MGATRTSKPFSLSFDSAFTDQGEWLITCHLRFRVRPRPASLVLEQARFALIEGLIREGMEARARGARRFKVELDTTAGPVIHRCLWLSIGDLGKFL